MKKILFFAISITALLLLWWIIAKKIAAPLVLPYPADVWSCIVSLVSEKKFAASFIKTLLRCFSAFSLALIFGFALGLFSALCPAFSAFIEPILALVRSVPVVSVILLALFWLKSDGVPIFVSFLMTLPVMTNAVRAGFSNHSEEDRRLFEMAETFSLTRFQRLIFLFIPRAFPSVASGAKSIAGMTWKLVCAGEVLSLPKSAAGTFLQNAQVLLETADVFAITIIIVFASFIFCSIVNFFLYILKKSARFFTKIYFLYDNLVSIPFISVKKIPESSGVPVAVKNLFVRLKEILYDDFSVDFAPSTLTSILAPSGLGKTTLLRVISKKMRENGASVSQLFQEPRLLPHLTVLENAMLPLLNFFGAKQSRHLATEMLVALSLLSKLDSFPPELSGGEKQRAAMARAFLFPANILLLDEPFQSQDFAGKMRLIRVFQKIRAEKKSTVIAVTHDPHEAALLKGRILLLKSRPAKISLDIDTKDFSANEVEKMIIENLLTDFS